MTDTPAPGPRVDPWLVHVAPLLLRGPPGPLLDLACGSGHNACYLARRRLSVVAVDADPGALAAARLGAPAGNIEFRQMKVGRDNLPPGPWAGICVFHFLDRSLFPLLERSLAAGGYLVYKTHLDHPLREAELSPRRRAYRLRSGELLRSFPHLEPLAYREWAGDGRAYAALLARRGYSST